MIFNEVVLTFELPKISLNDWYSGSIHWSKRKKIKDQYIWIVRSVTNRKFTEPCEVEYVFEFKKNALDASNCVAMVKMLEDCIFEDDGIKVVKKISIESRKSDKEQVTVTIRKCQT
jgi:hypothetical protein